MLAAAKALAVLQRKGVGEVISELMRQALRPDAKKAKVRNGVLLLAVGAKAKVVTPELVNQFRDELPDRRIAHTEFISSDRLLFIGVGLRPRRQVGDL